MILNQRNSNLKASSFMDPLTQGVVGAVFPQSTFKRSHMLLAGLFGLVGGMAPDLDILINSKNDPLLYLEYHRQFTHSLIFIPIGGLICALLMHYLIGRRKSFPFIKTYIFCSLGYASHGLLDASTSYGTMLFWPFSDYRVAWSYISIIDPLFTLPVLTLVLLSAWRRSANYARIALAWGMLYIGAGAYQNQSAVKMGVEIAKARGHKPVSMSVKPSFGNLFLWKVIYRDKNTYYVDAVRVGWKTTIYPGASIAALDISRDFPWLDTNSQQARDIERFRWFSKGYIAKDPVNSNHIIDLRYSYVPNEIGALWSIELSPNANKKDHVDFVADSRPSQDHRETLWGMVVGQEPYTKLTQLRTR